MSNMVANREEALSVSLHCTTGTGGADALPGRAQFKKRCGEFGSLFSENDYATARSKLLECRGLQLNGLSLLEQSCSSVIIEIVELRSLLESALQLLLNYEELVSILLLIGCIETKKRKKTDISVVNARKFFLGLRRLLDNLRNERKQNVHGKSTLKSTGVTNSALSDIISVSVNLLEESNVNEKECNLGVFKESLGIVTDTTVVTGREFLSLPPPDLNKFIPGRNYKVESSNASLSLNECVDQARGRIGSMDRFMRVNGSRGTGEDGKEKEREKDLDFDRDNASLHIKLGPMSAHTLSSGRKMMASIPMVPSTLSHYNHSHSSWRSDGLSQVLGARNGKSRLPALPSLSVSAASTAPASPCLSPSRQRGQVKGVGHFESSDRLEENETATLDYRNHATAVSGLETPDHLDSNGSTYCTMERMANLYLNSQAEYASDSSSPEGTLFLRARLDICSPEITSGYSSDDADADAGTSASAAELFGIADPGSLIADVTVADAVAELEEEEGATSGTGTELGIGMGMGVGIAGGGGGGGDGGSEKVSATSPLFLSLMMKKMVIPFPVNNQSRRDSKNNPFFPSAVQLIAQPPSNSTNTSRRGSFSSARSSSTKQSVVSFSQPDIPASAVRLLEMEIKRNLRRKSHAKKPAQNSEDRQKFLPNRASGRSYCEIFEISKNDVQLDIDSMYGEKEEILAVPKGTNFSFCHNHKWAVVTQLYQALKKEKMLISSLLKQMRDCAITDSVAKKDIQQQASSPSHSISSSPNITSLFENGLYIQRKVFYNILYGHLSEYMAEEDWLLLLWTLDPTDSCRISLTDFACTIRLIGELTSSSSLILSGLEVVIALFSHGFKDKDFPVTIGVGRPRAFSKVGQGISLSSPLQSLAPTSISRQCLSLPLSIPEIPLGLRLSKVVILSVLSSVCTSMESEMQLCSHLDPFFLGNISAGKNEQKSKNSLTSSSINDSELSSSDRQDSKENKKIKSMDSQSKRISELLKVVSVQHKRRKSDGNKKLLAHQRRRGRSSSTGSDVGETNIGVGNDQLPVQLPIKTKSDRTKILDAAVESLLYEGDDVVEMAKRLSYQSADGTVSESMMSSKEPSDVRVIENQVPVPIEVEVEVAMERLHAAMAMQAADEVERLSAKEAQTAVVMELFSVEAVCHFVSITPSLQQLFEGEIRSVMCQLVSASTRYLIGAKAVRKGSDYKQGDQNIEEK